MLNECITDTTHFWGFKLKNHLKKDINVELVQENSGI